VLVKRDVLIIRSICRVGVLLNSLKWFRMLRVTANGPAIKGVSVPAIGGVARFLPSSCKFFEFYECRGTMFIGSRLPVPLHEFD
jgi:hypothetical protein